jgi:hypothetical protein
MTAVGIVGILLSFVAFAWFSRRKDNRSLALFLIITILHVISAYIYYLFVQNNDADTKMYYFDLYDFYANGFGLGTMFIVYVTQSLLEAFGGTYLDYFLVYQALGIWGIALIMRTIEEMSGALQTETPPLMLMLQFLPGMYFWTSAIGKDAPLFFACALAVWSCFRISSRWFWFGLAVAIMVLIRAHVALLTVVSLTLALVAGRGVPTAARVLLVGTSAVASVFLFGTLQAELQVDLTSVGSVASFVEQQTDSATRGVDQTLANASFPVKLFSVLYRPLFFDSSGLFGLIASFQNLIMVAITFLLIRNFRLWLELFRGSLAIRFASIHFVALFLMLAFMYYNVGLGLRQREMATPALIITFSAVWMLSRLRQRATTALPTPSREAVRAV